METLDPQAAAIVARMREISRTLRGVAAHLSTQRRMSERLQLNAEGIDLALREALDAAAGVTADSETDVARGGMN